MKPDDHKKFFAVLGGVHDFYGKELSEYAVTVWLQACEKFDVQQVTKALSAHLMDAERGQFMPKPADIVRQLQGTNTDRSMLAWGKAMDAAARVGAYRSVCFDDGLIHAVVEDMGGWTKFCRAETDELGYIQKRFCDSYKAYAGRGQVVYPALLRGEHDAVNALKGHRTAEPVLIGDPEAAKRVHSLGSTAPKTQITHAAEFAPQVRQLGRVA